MTIELLLSLLGSFLSLLMIVNAFFTRQTLQAITEVRLELAKVIVKHDATEERSRRNESEISSLRDRLHGVEGGQKSTVQLFEIYENEINDIKKRLNKNNS